MPNAFVRKLRRFADLEQGDVAALVHLVAQPIPRPAGIDLVQQGDRPVAMQLLLEGWACRYKELANGTRQIVGFLLPGDSCDLHVTLLEERDHGIRLITDAQAVAIPARTLDSLLARHPNIEAALWRSTLADEAILREWLINMGRRDAHARVGHLICEIWHRLKAIGQVDERNGFAFPLVQEQIGDAVGLTSVHVNRMFRRLREEGLVVVRNRHLTVMDPARLIAVSEFDPAYLHDRSESAKRTGSRSTR